MINKVKKMWSWNNSVDRSVVEWARCEVKIVLNSKNFQVRMIKLPYIPNTSHMIICFLKIRILAFIFCVQNELAKNSAVKTQENKVATRYPMGLSAVIPANNGK